MTQVPPIELLRQVHENQGAFPELAAVQQVILNVLAMQGISQMQVPAHEVIAGAVAAAAAALQLGPHEYVRARLAKAGIVPMSDGTYSHTPHPAKAHGPAATVTPMPEDSPGWVHVQASLFDRFGNRNGEAAWWSDQTVFTGLEVFVDGRLYAIKRVTHNVAHFHDKRALRSVDVEMREVVR